MVLRPKHILATTAVLFSAACTISRTYRDQVPLQPAHPLVGAREVRAQALAGSGGISQEFDAVEMCKGMGEFPKFLERGEADDLWQDLASQWASRAPHSKLAFESAYAAAFRGFENDLSRLLRQKRQFPTLRRFLSYTRNFGQWDRRSQEIDFLTRGLIPEQPCHPAVYGTLMSHWLRSLDPLAEAKLPEQPTQDSVTPALKMDADADEDEPETDGAYTELERSFGWAWIVDGRISLTEALELIQVIRGAVPIEDKQARQWVWDLSQGAPSEKIQQVLITGLAEMKLVSWVWGDASLLKTWTGAFSSYYEAPQVCELKSHGISVVAACEPVRASRIVGQDPQQDLWLAEFSRERARRLKLLNNTH